jgi:SAM-dependent methyltransferase
MAIFTNKDEYKKWIEREDWYQTITLPSGLITPGKVPTQLREPLFDSIDFKGKTFIDVGCNSGQYCLMAKARGARAVTGIDVQAKRIAQARVIAENEGLDVTYEERSIFDTDNFGRFDILFCIAVLTEIQDTFGAIEKLKNLIGKYALIELDIAKPVLYASLSTRWIKGYPDRPRRTAVTEVREIRGGKWAISPSLDVLRAVFGKEFKITSKGKGIRYDVIEVVRVAG